MHAKKLRSIFSCFGLVLWYINHCRLFNSKYCLYIYIKYMFSKYFDNILKWAWAHLFFTQMISSVAM